MANNPRFVDLFIQEAKLLASLSHPNIVAVYDRGQADGSYYIAMEYLDGRTLKELIVRNGPTPIPIAIDYARQVLAAMQGDHAEVGVALLEKGVHVLVEKPIAATVADAQRMIDAAKAKKP